MKFYANIPAYHDSNLVEWDSTGYFKRFCVKFGEASGMVSGRTHREGQNTMGLITLYEFPDISEDLMRKAYGKPTRKMHFDDFIFGHTMLNREFENTIFASFNSKKIFIFKAPEGTNYGDEYIDIADDINLWLKENGDDLYLMKNFNDLIMAYEIAAHYFQAMMPQYLKKFYETKLNAKFTRKEFHFRDYQVKVYEMFIQMLEQDIKWITAELPPRWGKTKTMLKLFSESHTKVMVLFAYTKCVNESYRGELLETDFGAAEIQYVDANDSIDHVVLDPNQKVVIAINTACEAETVFKKRADNVKKLLQLMNVDDEDVIYINEEADYGNHTDLSAYKIDSLGITKNSYVLSITGTGAEKADKIFDDAEHIVVNLNDWYEVHYTGINHKIKINLDK